MNRDQRQPHQGRTEVQYCGTGRIKDYATLNLVIYSDQQLGTIKLSNGALGNVRITTLKAFSLDETKKIIDSLK